MNTFSGRAARILLAAVLAFLFESGGTMISKAHANAGSETGGASPVGQSWWNPEKLGELLAGPGIEGEVHAVRADTSLFVFTLRNPENFFEFVHFSLVPKTAGIERALSALMRHDRVRIRGQVLKNRSPQIHIEVSALEMVRKYEPGMPLPPYEYEVTLPADLPRNDRGEGEDLFLVHAVHSGGQILVVEYKDAVIPIFVREPKASASLYRNDIIRIAYKIQNTPSEPIHLKLRTDVAEPIVLVESALSKHGQPADLIGPLVLFPKSPQVSVDVFALLEKTQGGATRQYTLANFESPEAFRAIREKCQQAWARDPSNFVNGRNKAVHSRIRVRARGVFNVVDPNQANVQILLKNAEDLEFFLD